MGENCYFNWINKKIRTVLGTETSRIIKHCQKHAMKLRIINLDRGSTV